MMRHDPSTLINLFPPSERARVESGALRHAMLLDSAETAITERMADVVGADLVRRWGRPATHANPIPSIARNLSRPGHYGSAPTVIGEKAEEIAAAMESFWPVLQYGEYEVFGMGSCWRYVEAVPDGEQPNPSTPDLQPRCTVQIVPHHQLWCDPSPRDPTSPVVVRWLRLRPDPADPSQLVAVWDVWDLRSSAKPSYTVRLAGGGGEILEPYQGGALDMVGEAYPWRTPSGAPYLPWACHRRDHSGDLYNWHMGRNEPLAALDVIIAETETGAVAIQSTGRVAIVAGLSFAQASTRPTSDGSGYVQVVEAQPGDILVGSVTDPGVQPFVTEIGGSDHLEALASEATRRASRVSSMMGVTPSDAARVGANPMSGAAIHLTNAEKRAEQHRTTPMANAADQATIRHVMWALGVDPGRFALRYQVIRASPDEEREEREADEWSVAQGLESSVDVYLRRNPGLSRDEAIAQLRRVRADQREIEGPPEPAQAASTQQPAQDPEQEDDDNESDQESDDAER